MQVVVRAIWFIGFKWGGYIGNKVEIGHQWLGDHVKEVTSGRLFLTDKLSS
jgi:hypothetical protein